MNQFGKGPTGDAQYEISKLYAYPVSEKKFQSLPFLFPWSNSWPGGRASFDPRGITWTNFVEVHLEMLYTKYQSYTPFRSETKNFEYFLSCSYVRICDPRGRASLDPRGIIWINLVKVHLEMLHTKYQSCMSSSLRDEKFWSFPSLSLCSNLWPEWGVVSFGPRGIIWT